MSRGIPNIFPISYRYHYAQVDYEKYYDNSFKGKMIVEGGEWSLNGYLFFIPASITYGGNNYNSGDISQTTNYFYIGNPFVNLRYEDDHNAFAEVFDWLPGVPKGSGDKYRTSAVEINFFGSTFGYKLMTGEDAGGTPQTIDGYKYHNEKNIHRLGLIYWGSGSERHGVNSESIRNLLQNELIHKPGQRKNPDSFYLWNVLNIMDRGYLSEGSTGGSSLWY